MKMQGMVGYIPHASRGHQYNLGLYSVHCIGGPIQEYFIFVMILLLDFLIILIKLFPFFLGDKLFHRC